MNQFKKDQKGFTILEVLIALVILAVGILTVGVMQTTAIQGNATASHLTIANTANTDIIERLLNADYNDAALLSNGPHTDADFPAAMGFVLPQNVTSVSWTVKEGTSTDGLDDDGDIAIDEPDEVGMKFVTVVIQYADAGGKTRTINFYKHELL